MADWRLQSGPVRPSLCCCCWIIIDGEMTPGPRVRWGGVKGEMRMTWVLYLLTLQFCSDFFKHLTEVRCVTGINKWRGSCSKGTIKKTYSDVHWSGFSLANYGKYDEAEVKRWDGTGEWVWGEISKARCGLEGPPPVVVTLFGRLGVGSNHPVHINCIGSHFTEPVAGSKQKNCSVIYMFGTGCSGLVLAYPE